MGPSLKHIARSLMPPALWSAARAVKERIRPTEHRIAYAPAGWATPLAGSNETFWDVFIARERAACARLIADLNASRPLLAEDSDVKHMVFAYTLTMMSASHRRLAVLDYGSHLGDYYWRAAAQLPDVALEYHCKELPRVADAGQQVTPNAIWHADDTCLDRRYDLVMFSSSLQYLQDWKAVLRRAAAAVDRCMLLMEVPAVRHQRSFVVTQQMYGVTNVHWQLNRDEVLDTVAAAGLRLIREFDMGPYPDVTGAPEQPRCLGWLFEREAAADLRAHP